jgi:hypothetical protein
VPQSIDALAEALQQFEGGVVIISHDAQLLSRVCDETSEVRVFRPCQQYYCYLCCRACEMRPRRCTPRLVMAPASNLLATCADAGILSNRRMEDHWHLHPVSLAPV